MQVERLAGTNAGDGGGAERGRRCEGASPQDSARVRERDRHERERLEGREHGAGEEQEARTRVAPEKGEPDRCEDRIHDGEPERRVPEGEDGDGQREREACRGVEQRGHRGKGAEEERPAGREEGDEPRRGSGEERGEPCVSGPLGEGRPRRHGAWAVADLAPRDTQARGGFLRARPPRRIGVEHPVDRRRQGAREIRAQRGQGRRALLDALGGLERRERRERVPAGQRLPEEDADRPDICRTVRLSAGEALGGDVGEGAGDVAGGRQRLGLLELGEPEVEQAHGELVAVLDHDVSGLHVPVENLLPVCVGERVEDLGADLDRGGVVELAASQALPERLPGDVLVGDVDVVVVALERECA